MVDQATPPAVGAPEHRRVGRGTYVFEDDHQRGGGKRGRGHGRVLSCRYEDGRGMTARIEFDRIPGKVYRMTAKRAGDLKITHDQGCDCDE